MCMSPSSRMTDGNGERNVVTRRRGCEQVDGFCGVQSRFHVYMPLRENWLVMFDGSHVLLASQRPLEFVMLVRKSAV